MSCWHFELDRYDCSLRGMHEFKIISPNWNLMKKHWDSFKTKIINNLSMPFCWKLWYWKNLHLSHQIQGFQMNSNPNRIQVLYHPDQSLVHVSQLKYEKIVGAGLGPFISFSFSYVMLTFFSVFKTEGFQFVFPSVFERKKNLQFWN